MDNGKFTYPAPFDNGIRLKDVLEDNVDEKFYISNEKAYKLLRTMHEKITEKDTNVPMFIGNINSSDFGTGYVGGVWNTNGVSPTLTTMQGGGRQPHVITSLVSNKAEKFEKQIDVASTLLARDYKGFGNQASNAVIECEKCIVASRGRYAENMAIKQNLEFNTEGTTNALTSVQKDNLVFENNNMKIRIRKLTPKECFRLQGFADKDFYAAESVVSNTQLYKQVGNSITVDVLYYIFVELYKAMPYLFNDLKLSSFFSGIGAFESALDRLYEQINSGKSHQP